ncbi:MAG: hypothetical protein DRJ67_01430 [Thermoprotei archaeon]|mgnify:CR=1 FL=1|nr:MAG: hypothetical protein DRJ67_01430 [Thermoprotei archaeon]
MKTIRVGLKTYKVERDAVKPPSLLLMLNELFPLTRLGSTRTYVWRTYRDGFELLMVCNYFRYAWDPARLAAFLKIIEEYFEAVSRDVTATASINYLDEGWRVLIISVSVQGTKLENWERRWIGEWRQLARVFRGCR